MKGRILAVLLLVPAFSSMATCWKQAGDRYGIEPELLQAIAIVESNMDPKAVNKNTDGTIDVGLMQINSRHFQTLRKFSISQKDLINDPCQSVMTGAWILAGNIRQFGYSWEAVGAYNAGTGKTHKHQALRQKYIKKVALQYAQLKKGPKHKSKHSLS